MARTPLAAFFNIPIMTSEPIRVLVLCTGNSCRYIMAEALINHLGQERYHACSAGSHPTGEVHPRSIATLQRHGIDPGQPCSKSWDDLTNTAFDRIITVCDQAAGEPCPIFPGQPQKLHWSIPDPAKATGTESEINAAFDQAFFLLKERIEALRT
jgi:arsenate reductase